MAGFDVKKRPREFFLVFIGFILFSVSLYTTVFIIFSGSDKRTVPASAPRLQRRWHDLTHLQGLVTDLHNELSEAVAERDDLEIQLKQILETDDGKHIARWTNIIRPLKSRLPPRLRNKPLLSCAHIDAIQAVSRTAIGSSKIVQRALYGAKEVLVKSLNPDGKSVRNCMGKMTVGQCLTFASYRLLREMSLLADLQNDNVVEIIGRCVRGPSEESSDFTGKSLLLVTEYGDPVSIRQLQELPLKQKLEMSANILELLLFLKNSPLGSVRVEPFDLTQFRLFGDRLKLTHVDTVTTDEPLCKTHSDCIVQTSVGWQPGCIDNTCKGYNSLINMRDAYNNILTPLLLDSEGLSKKSVERITAILNSLQSDSNMSLVSIAEKLRNFAPSEDDNRQEENEDAAADRMSLFNDLNTEIHQKTAVAQEAAKTQTAVGAAQDGTKDDGKQIVGYLKIEDADFPGMYDYTCRRTRAKWGCVLAVYGLDDAKQKCNTDPQCQAFVMVPHHSRIGWSTAFFKNGASEYVRHEGTNVYIKQSTSQQTVGRSAGTQKPVVLTQKDDIFALKPTLKESVSQQNLSSIQNNHNAHTGTSCPLGEIFASQQSVRKERESQLMEDMGWAGAGMTDQKWQHLLRTGTLNAEDFMKVTADSNGGGIYVTVTGDQVQKGWFKVEPGTDSRRRHIAHIALFYLDRLLGMYQTVPTTGRILSLQEMQRAHFSSIPNEAKGRFAALLTPDGTLHGSISAWINHDLHIKRKLSISPSTELAWAISPLTQEQKNDLEYLMVMWLGRLNQPPNQFFSTGGRMVHFDNYVALLVSAVDVFPYFNVCQFPRHVVQTLKYMQRNAGQGCKLSEQLAEVLQNDPLHLMPDDFTKLDGSSLSLLDDEAAKLLDIVQECVDRFGETITLYS